LYPAFPLVCPLDDANDCNGSKDRGESGECDCVGLHLGSLHIGVIAMPIIYANWQLSTSGINMN
jgi:hypothetical protein